MLAREWKWKRKLLKKLLKKSPKSPKSKGYRSEFVLFIGVFVGIINNNEKVEIFKAFAKKYKKKSGSVRNMYYALAKQGEVDFKVKVVEPFDLKQEDEIIRHVLIEKEKEWDDMICEELNISRQDTLELLSKVSMKSLKFNREKF